MYDLLACWGPGVEMGANAAPFAAFLYIYFNN